MSDICIVLTACCFYWAVQISLKNLSVKVNSFHFLPVQSANYLQEGRILDKIIILEGVDPSIVITGIIINIFQSRTFSAPAC